MDDERDMPRGLGLGWFWIGAGAGLLLSATAVVVTAELTRRRYLRPGEPGYLQGEVDLVQDLTTAVEGGLGILAHAVQAIGQSFRDARSEVIRYGLDPSGASASSSYAWYTGEDDEPLRPGE